MQDFFDILARFLSGDIFGHRILCGSQRQFFRVPCYNNSCIILIDDDVSRLSKYAILLENLVHRGIPVPRVFAVDETAGAMAMEDVGNLSLFDWYRISGDVEPHFRAVRALVKIHSIGDVPGQMETEFNVIDFFYETQYFLRQFLVNYCGYSESIGDALLCEFQSLAHQAADSPKGLMHRDYQSQNIFIVSGGVRIVDFQGARRGFLAYDIASLAEDPYIYLPESSRKRILNEYLNSTSLPTTELRRLIKAYPYIAIQRLLQATAAFSYLSVVKGKQWFGKFIIPAIERAEQWIEATGKFPLLLNVIQQAKSIVTNKL